MIQIQRRVRKKKRNRIRQTKKMLSNSSVLLLSERNGQKSRGSFGMLMNSTFSIF